MVDGKNIPLFRETYSLEGTDVNVIAIDLEQHFLDYGKVAKGHHPLKGDRTRFSDLPEIES